MFCPHVYLCATCMPIAFWGQKMSELLELELQMVVIYHVGARN